jgi:hypothetical protein
MSELAKNEEMEAKVSVNGQMVYVFYVTPSYYLVSLHADGTRRFKAEKMKPVE